MGIINRVNQMVEQLDANIDKHNVAKYKIIETSERLGNYIYIAKNVKVEYEDGCICFSDAEDIILNGGYALMGFLIESVKNIVVEDKLIEIVFDYNSIKIELVV